MRFQILVLSLIFNMNSDLSKELLHLLATFWLKFFSIQICHLRNKTLILSTSFYYFFGIFFLITAYSRDPNLLGVIYFAFLPKIKNSITETLIWVPYSSYACCFPQKLAHEGKHKFWLFQTISGVQANY